MGAVASGVAQAASALTQAASAIGDIKDGMRADK